MTSKKSTAILILVSSILLFLLSITQFQQLLQLLIPKMENLTYSTNTVGGQFRFALFFSIIVGLTPVLLYFTWNFASIRTIKNKIASSFIIVSLMVTSILLRKQSLKSSISELVSFKTETGDTITNAISIEDLHFDYYLIGGQILGCLLTYLIFKKLQPSKAYK